MKSELPMVLNIIEPTLNSYTGHCYSLVDAIAQAAPVDQVRIWAGRESAKFWQGRGRIEPYFFRSIRKFQSYFLFRRLLAEPGKMLLSTAGTSDLLLLDWAARSQIPENKVYLYVHWLGGKAAKASKLAKVARMQPNLEVLCATASTTSFFKDLGFRSATVSYPRSREASSQPPAQTFRHLLFAGAARLDKGFGHIADLVEDLAQAQAQAQWPIWVQASSTHQARHGPEILSQIVRLRESGYANLTLLENTLSPQEYQSMFSGAISIQPYSASDFEDRVSGVTLDALSAGCPVVVTANTWLGRVVMKHNAGVVTTDLSPLGLKKAVDEVLRDYAGYAQRAAKAGQLLSHEHSAAEMMAAIFQNVTTQTA
jgi:hypothetical protein